MMTEIVFLWQTIPLTLCVYMIYHVCSLFADRGVVSVSSANRRTSCQQMQPVVCILKEVCYESLMVRWWRVMSGTDESVTITLPTPPATAQRCICSKLASPWAPTAVWKEQGTFSRCEDTETRININIKTCLPEIYSKSLLSLWIGGKKTFEWNV